jgi:hypothetical protein
MELSPLLAVGIVLLVAVLALSRLQKSQQVDRSAAGRPSTGTAGTAPPVRAAEAGDRSSKFAFSKDDLLGVIVFDDGIWAADDDAAFAGTTVIVEVHGELAGLTEAQSETVRLALTDSRDLDARARAVIQQELDRQGITDATMEAYELTVRPGRDGREAGFLWYDVKQADREMGVSSTDGWKTLTLETPDS